MRVQVTFVSGVAWGDLSHGEIFTRAREMEAYGARVSVVTLPAHVDTLTADSPFRERHRDEKAVVVELTFAALADYCSDNDVVATLVAQRQWDVTSDGDQITHHLFISDADPG